MDKVLDGYRILVVEDDPKSMDIATKLLTYYGAKTYSAFNGIEGLAYSQVYQPDLIVSDLSMPGMSGWQMIKELKENTDTSDIPIIAMTAHTMPRNKNKAMKIGCDHFIAKPLNPMSFVEDIKLVLNPETIN